MYREKIGCIERRSDATDQNRTNIKNIYKTGFLINSFFHYF